MSVDSSSSCVSLSPSSSAASKRADHVILGRLPPLLDDTLEIVEELLGRLLDPSYLFAVEQWIDRERDIVGPLPETRSILCWNAQHLGDDDDRQREGKIANQIDPGFAGDRVQEFVNKFLDARPELPYSARGKGFGDKARATWCDQAGPDPGMFDTAYSRSCARRS